MKMLEYNAFAVNRQKKSGRLWTHLEMAELRVKIAQELYKSCT